MASEVSGGTQAATLTTEHTLATITDGSTYVLAVDVSELVNGDTLTLRAKVKARSSSTSKECYSASYAHAQSDLVVLSIPVPAPHEVVFTLTQHAGTGRNFEWAVYDLAA